MIDEENLQVFIRERIKALREQSGFTVNSLAYRSGVSQSYIRDIELGNKCNISVDKLFQICLEFDISLSDFFNEAICPEKPDPLESKIRSMTQEQYDYLLGFLDRIIL